MKHSLPAVDVGPTIDRLRAIADQSTNALLTEGPVQPDHQLLDLCAEALHYRRLHDEAHAAWRANYAQRLADCARKPGRQLPAADRAASNAEQAQADGYVSAMRRVLFKAKKIKATTAAGIYAKALIVRSSKSGAPLLAMSLADDLIKCPGLRASLWPAREA